MILFLRYYLPLGERTIISELEFCLASFAGRTMERDLLLYTEAPPINFQSVLRLDTWQRDFDAAVHVPCGMPARALGSFDGKQLLLIPRCELVTFTWACSSVRCSKGWYSWRKVRPGWLEHLCEERDLIEGADVPWSC